MSINVLTVENGIKAEDLVEDFHPGSCDMVRKSVERTICISANLPAKDDPGKICMAIKDPLQDIRYVAWISSILQSLKKKVSAAIVSCTGWEKCAFSSHDFEGEEP